MPISNIESFQRSDWSGAASISPSRTHGSNVKNQISLHSFTVDPAVDRLSSSNKQCREKNDTKKCRLSTCCSSIPPLICGLLIGILLGCSILAVILPIWLVKTTTPKAVAAPQLRWNPTGITVAGLVGNPGNGNNQFRTPVDIVLDLANNFYIADFDNNRIQKYLFNTLIGITVAGSGLPGLSPSQFARPSRLIVDSNEDLSITDTGNSRIQFWKKGALNATTIAGITGNPGNGNDQLLNPYGIVRHPTSGALFIADYGNHRLMSYAAGAKNGTLLLGGNGPGINNTQLCTPLGLYYDSFSNTLVIANFDCNNIVRYAFGASSWTLVAGSISGSSGATASTFTSPIDMTFDPMGNMYVADRGNHRIQFFSAGEMNGITIAGITGINGSNATTLNRPWSLKLDSQLNLYVTDSSNHRIQKFLRY